MPKGASHVSGLFRSSDEWKGLHPKVGHPPLLPLDAQFRKIVIPVPSKQTSVSTRSSDCLAQCIDALGTTLQGRLPGARVALGHNLFSTFAETALKCVPASTNPNRAVADHY